MEPNRNKPTECTYEERILGVQRMFNDGIKIGKIATLSGFDISFLKKINHKIYN